MVGSIQFRIRKLHKEELQALNSSLMGEQIKEKEMG
jgi:hypothetical protein